MLTHHYERAFEKHATPLDIVALYRRDIHTSKRQFMALWYMMLTQAAGL